MTRKAVNMNEAENSSGCGARRRCTDIPVVCASSKFRFDKETFEFPSVKRLISQYSSTSSSSDIVLQPVIAQVDDTGDVCDDHQNSATTTAIVIPSTIVSVIEHQKLAVKPNIRENDYAKKSSMDVPSNCPSLKTSTMAVHSELETTLFAGNRTVKLTVSSQPSSPIFSHGGGQFMTNVSLDTNAGTIRLTVPSHSKHSLSSHSNRRRTWTGCFGDDSSTTLDCRRRHQSTLVAAVRKTSSFDQPEPDDRNKCSTGADGFVIDSQTPSVIISDHSDDASFASSTMTLQQMEELVDEQAASGQELLWRRLRGGSSEDSSSECSASSSWSIAENNYCITQLDGDYHISRSLSCGNNSGTRKLSDCSSISGTSSYDYDDVDDCGQDDQEVFRYHGQLTDDYPVTCGPSGWRKLRSIVQWTPFFQTYKKHRYPWVQLAGHQGNFKAGPEPGTILKKLCPKEQMCFQVLMKDPLKHFVPQYRGYITTDDGQLYLQLQDLLSEFTSPCVMDCKIGVRTYLEEELAKAKEKPKLRKDMYEKMIQIDPNAPTDEEHKLKGVTKPRYMVWRETISSTAALGFRIEGVRKSDGKSSKDFKTTKTSQQILHAFRDFCDGFPDVIEKYLARLNAIKSTLEISKFFATHEVIGSSLLFVHDNDNAGVWLIDFAKTVILPADVRINHASDWIVGNHEDGYLIGLNNLIDIFGQLSSAYPDNDKRALASDDEDGISLAVPFSSLISDDVT